MTINVYQKGDLVRLGPEDGATALFTNSAGEAIDPTDISLFVTPPSGVVVEYVYGVDAEVVKDSTGNYHADISADEAGQWQWKWMSTGTGQAAAHGEFVVEPSDFVVA